MIKTVSSGRPCPYLRLIGLILIICALSFYFRSAGAETQSNGRELQPSNPDFPIQSDKAQAHLYFASRQNFFLKSEQRIMVQAHDPVDFGRAVVNALIKGPQTGLIRTIPAGTELRAIYLDPDNICYVDLSEAVKTNHPGGSRSEMLTIYSVVNSLILNVTEIKRVKILINGNEASTLAGHINLQTPFKAYMLIIR